jgi:DNA-binding NtrC family response regulator
LRERKEDILWLAGRLLKTCKSEKASTRILPRSAEKALLDYPWPGNIRELKHCLERACILSQQNVLTAELLFDDVPSAPPEQSQGSESLNEYLHACERKYIEDRLSANGGRIAETAAALGISRKNLWEKMKKLEIQNEAAQ